MAQRINFKACKTALTEAAKDLLSDSEAEDFIKSFEVRIQNFRDGNKLVNVEDKLKEVVGEFTQDLTKIALIQKRNALLARKAANTLEKSAKTYASPAEGILGFLEDSQRSIEGAGRGVNAVIEGHKAKYLGELRGRLEKEGLWDDFRKDTLEKEIFQEFYNPGSSGSEKAGKIRDIMFSLKQDMVQKQNLFGSFIHFLPEHVKRQEWNVELIKKQFGPERFKRFFNTDRYLTPEEHEKTFQGFAQALLPLLDHEETFKDTDPMKFLRGAFDGIMSGKHGSYDAASGSEINSKFFRTGALAKKVSVQRLLHFKDGDSAHAAYSLFSGNPLSGGFVSELEHGATNIGLMQMLGPNPENTITTTLDKLEHEYSRNGENQKQAELSKNRHKIMTALKFLDRSAMIPSNPDIHTATATVISLLSQAKLGKIMLFALPDRALVQSVLTRNGMKGMDALGAALRILPPKSPEERIRLMMMGAELKAMNNTVNSRFSTGAEGGIPTLVANSQKAFFHLSGIEWLDNLGTQSIIHALPQHLGIMADHSFEKLMPELQNVFKIYGITPTDWDAWRSTAYHTDAAGAIKEGRGDGSSAWITPDRFGTIPNEAIDRILSEKKTPISDNNRKRARIELEEKFQTWLTAQRDQGVLMPGSKEHRIATLGTQAGTPAGSLMRLLMMFKTFPLTMYTKILRREMQGNGAQTFKDWMAAEKNSNFHTTQLIGMMTIAGYLSMSIDNVLSGKNPRTFYNQHDEFDVNQSTALVRDAFLRGGAGGLMADLLTREYDQGYKNILRTVTGPVGNETMKLASMFSDTVRGKANPREALDFARGNLPFANLFYVKPALDHLIFNNINEWLDPGYIRRIERQSERDGQGFWLKPK